MSGQKLPFLAFELKCITCQKLLNVAPITTCEGGSVCGRCNGDREEPAKFRNKPFEALIRNVLFPCTYKDLGCGASERPADMQQHEAVCAFREVDCPISPLGSCAHYLSVCQLPEHFRMCHATLLFADRAEFIVHNRNREANYLLEAGGSVHVLQTHYVHSEGLLSCNVCSLSGNAQWFRLEVSNSASNKSVLFRHAVARQLADLRATPAAGAALRVQLNTLQPLVDAEAPLVRVSLEGGEAPPVPDVASVCDQLECPVCNLHMTASIYNCPNGHSCCGDCRSRLTACPLCRLQCDFTRNLALEALVEQLRRMPGFELGT